MMSVLGILNLDSFLPLVIVVDVVAHNSTKVETPDHDNDLIMTPII